MKSIVLDVPTRPASAFAAKVIAEFPKLNVLMNNAGIMRAESLKDAPARPARRRSHRRHQLLGPIRLTAALMPHL